MLQQLFIELKPPEGMSWVEFAARLTKIVVLLFFSFSMAADVTPFFYQRF